MNPGTSIANIVEKVNKLRHKHNRLGKSIADVVKEARRQRQQYGF